MLTELARQVPGVIYQFLMRPDGSSCFPFASEAIRDIYEVAPEEVQEDASIVFSRLHPADYDRIAASIAESARTLEPWAEEYRVRLPARGLRYLSGVARPERRADGSTLWHGFISDVTDRQVAQQELLRLNMAMQSALNGIAMSDITGRITYVNPAVLELWGLTDPSQAIGQLASSFWDSPERLVQVRHALAARGADSGEMTALRADGTRRTLQFNANVFNGPDGTPAGLLASFADVTASRAVEADLRLKEQAIATSLTAIAISDATATVVYANPAFVRMWGYDGAHEVVGRPATRFADPAQVERIIATLMTTGVYQGELRATRKDGVPFDIVMAANITRNAKGEPEHLMGSFLDLTESKKLQAQLLQSQKMQTVGRLAGGVAHDFNNLLTVMKGYLDLARLQLPPESPVTSELAEVDRAVDSAAGLTQQLLAFSRQQIIDPQVLDLNASVRRMHAMLSRLLGEDIELRQVTAPDLGLVRFDPTQAEQILVNLCVNARDAMPTGGKLTLETANVVLDSGYVREHPDAAEGEYVMLAVTDTGCGMTEEVRAQIFEPFFTTKAPGRGTGLGLPMVFGAVSQNSGRIEVYSEVGRGSTFKIYLPRVNADASPRISPATGTLPHGTETIAVVEDEDAIRALAVRVLTGLGYEVLPFRTGLAALTGLAPIIDQVDLVLTDVVMPEMTGRTLTDRLRAQRPGLRVLFASGYTEDVIGHHGVLEAGADFLPKPYSTAALARRVRAALDRATPA